MTLYVVATPLGNLEDISERQKRVLAQVDSIFAEDTRHTRKLLSHLGIAAGGKLQALHRHNECQASERIVERLLAAELSAAVVSDAGTPAIADPGGVLVAAAHRVGINVVPVVGPSALAASLSVCGFDTQTVHFFGFVREKRRQARLETLAHDPACVVLYVAPHDLQRTLAVLAGAAPNRPVCLCRELTKLYEDVRVQSLAELALQVDALKVRGEITLVLSPMSAPEESTDEQERVNEIDAALGRCLKGGLSRRDAAQAVALSLDLRKRLVMARCNLLAGAD